MEIPNEEEEGRYGKYKPPTIFKPHPVHGTNFLLPIFKTRIPIWSHETKKHMHYQDTSCADYEKDFYTCMETVGYQRMAKACPEILHDYEECRSGRIANKRFNAMMLERKRQRRQFMDPPHEDIVRIPVEKI